MGKLKFNHTAKRFSRINLAYLAYCSKLVYRPQDQIKNELEEQGFNLKGAHYFISDTETDTQCFIAGDEKKIILAFRGTESGKTTDWTTDARIFKKTWTPEKPMGKVHRGFYDALDSVWDDIEKEFKRLKTGNQSVWITGHSLGGALAALAGGTLRIQRGFKVHGIYTFGQPRVGDYEFARSFNAILQHNCFRIVNNNDIVTRVAPQLTGYSHVGMLKYFTSDGKLMSDKDLTWWARFWDRLEGRYDASFDFEITPDGIEDHSVSMYLQLSENAANTTK